MIDADALHRDAIVIDAVSPLTRHGQHLQRYRDGGVTVVAPTVAGWEDASTTLRTVGLWHRLFRERDGLIHVRRAADIERAKREDKLGIVLHFQNTSPMEDSLDLVDAWKALGIGMVQLTYNVRNPVGDGCEESATVGLSRFGRQMVERLDAARIVVDGSHTGRQTVLDAIAIVKRPFVVSHANALAVHGSPRNLDDEVIRKVADSGGLVGLVGFPAFVGPGEAPDLDAFLAHADHIVKVAGHDHIGLGLDHYVGQHGISSPEQARARSTTSSSPPAPGLPPTRRRPGAIQPASTCRRSCPTSPARWSSAAGRRAPSASCSAAIGCVCSATSGADE